MTKIVAIWNSDVWFCVVCGDVMKPSLIWNASYLSYHKMIDLARWSYIIIVQPTLKHMNSLAPQHLCLPLTGKIDPSSSHKMRGIWNVINGTVLEVIDKEPENNIFSHYCSCGWFNLVSCHLHAQLWQSLVVWFNQMALEEMHSMKEHWENLCWYLVKFTSVWLANKLVSVHVNPYWRYLESPGVSGWNYKILNVPFAPRPT